MQSRDENFFINQMLLHRSTMLLVYLVRGRVLVPFSAWQLLFCYPLGVLDLASVRNRFLAPMIHQLTWVMNRERVSSIRSGNREEKDTTRLSEQIFSLNVCGIYFVIFSCCSRSSTFLFSYFSFWHCGCVKRKELQIFIKCLSVGVAEEFVQSKR